MRVPGSPLSLPAVVGTLAALLLAACTGSSATPVAPVERPRTPTTYVALGDSVAAGVGAPSRDRGYVRLLAEGLRERLGCDDDAGAPGCPLRLVDLAVSGATTSTVLAQQLPRAAEALRDAAAPRLVTLTVGGNDLFGPVVGACAQDPQAPACRSAVTSALREVDRGVDRVLDGVRAAAGPDTVVAVMTYADPVPACRLASLSGLSAQVLEGTGGQPGLNDVLRRQASAHGAVVVETHDLLEVPDDFVGGDDCLHPSATGHARTAEAFLRGVGDLVGR